MRAEDIYPAGRVALREVGLRDGLQMVRTYPSTAGKIRWIKTEYDAGVRHFEVGSFLPAAKFPQFADVLDLIATVRDLPGAHGMALALNAKGAVRALDSGVAEIGCVVSASEEHNLRNVRRTRDQSLAEIAEICALRDQSAHRPIISVGLPMSFGCSIAGAVDPDEVMRLAARCLDAGVDVITLSDTVGYAGPDQVAALCRRLTSLVGTAPFGVHLHDTRGLGLANAAAALDEGARLLDGALGGMGGCPFAPNAAGNVVFEDLAFLCQTKGFDTGIDIPRLVDVRKIQTAEMPGEPTFGAVARAGLPLIYRPAGRVP